MAGLTVPVVVTARLQQGAALDARYGTALDGLLTSQVRAAGKRALSMDGNPVPGSLLDGGQHRDDPAEVALPLARCGTGDDWHWMATTAQPLDHAGQTVAVEPDVHHITNRHDHRRAETASTRLPKSVHPSMGRYRSRRLPVVTFPAAALRWRAVGDPQDILALLAPLATIGARRGVGEGTVLAWTVQEHTAGDPDTFGHLHADGTLGRPCPPACADRLGVTGTGIGLAGLRPPYWHHARQRMLALPGYPEGAHHAP